MLLLLSLAFVLSGVAGLIYESIWSRYLSLFVGHSAYAQIIVLVIFLGGMSLGAFIVGDRSSRLQQPLLWYAGVEFVIGLIGFFFHDVFVAATTLAYAHWFPSLAGGFGQQVVKWGLAGILILPQSVLLGSTFPLMAAGAVRLPGAVERKGYILALLYFANSLGAAAGVLIAGFLLIAWLGLPGTLLSAAVLNFVVAFMVFAAVRSDLEQPARHELVSDSVGEADSWAAHLPLRSITGSRLLLGIAFGTAVASFIYEIAWIRMLSLVLGSATHSFELMLSAFILGLATGAFWMRRHADGFAQPLRTLGVVQWAMGMLAIATLPVYVSSFRWTATLLETFKSSDAGYHGFGIARYAICIAVMVPATFCAGITLPLITKILMDAGAGERSIGAVYGVNTLGSIVGVVLAGLVLMPLVGLKALLICGALVDIAVGILILTRAGRPETHEATGAQPQFMRRLRALSGSGAQFPLPVIAAATSIFLVATTATFVRFDRSILASGVYRHAIVPEPGTYVFAFYKDGRTATVSVRRFASDTGAILTLATNGKPDASVEAVWRRPYSPRVKKIALEEDLATQVLLPIITLAHAPRAREGAVIGEGSGMSSHFLLGSPYLARLTTIEIEPEIVNASRAFMPANRRVFTDRRSRFVIDDAKSVFAASARHFDLILSEPSNPWVSGVSGLFTVEFYQHVRQHLAADGVFGQWLHLYEIDDDLVTSVLAALDAVFPAYQIFLTSNADLLVVATSSATLREPDWSVLQYPGIAEDMRRVVPIEPGSMEAMRLASSAVLHPYLIARAARNSDYYPILDLGTERTRFLHSTADGMTSFGEGQFDLDAALTGRRRAPVTSPIPPAPEIPRVAAIALSARLRIALDSLHSGADSGADGDFRQALYRVRQFERGVASGLAPSDWKLWLRDAISIDSTLHAGTAGIVDEAYFATLRQYAAKASAPPPVVSGIEYLHGMAAWDWPEISRAAAVLIDEQRRGVSWMPIDLLREGAVVAKLRQHDANGARAVFHALAPFGEPTFRQRVLAALVLQAER